MIMAKNSYGAVDRLVHGLRGMEPAERLVVLSMWALTTARARDGYIMPPGISLTEIVALSGLEEVEACKAALLALLRGRLKAGAGPWDFVLDANWLA